LGLVSENNRLKIPLAETESFLDFLNREISNQGRPFSFVQLENIRKGEDGILLADLKIHSSKKRQIDKIVIKGYEKFPRGFLKHFVGIKTGQEFNKKLLDEKVERLENIRFASSIKPPQVQFTKDSTAVYLYLEKRKSNSFDGFLGFSNDEEDSKLQVTGHVDVVLLNNLNFGESLHLEYKSDGDEQTQFRAEVDLPFLFQTPFGLNLGLDIFKKDSTFTTVDQRARLKYQFNEKLSAFVGYRHSESNNLLDEDEQTVGGVIEDFSANFTSIGGQYLVYNTYNDLFPIKTSLNLELGYGTRERFQEETTQWLAVLDFSQIFELNRRNTIYVRNLSSFLSSDNYLTNELFRFGGINSLRGFEENSIAASLFSSTQSEYRFLLASNLYIHSIVDYAYFENEVLGLRENLYGVGFGIGLQTDAGLLKVNFANGKTDGQDFEFANTKIHLSLTTLF
jgi:outer membrane protein assembly factor BamA